MPKFLAALVLGLALASPRAATAGTLTQTFDLSFIGATYFLSANNDDHFFTVPGVAPFTALAQSLGLAGTSLTGVRIEYTPRVFADVTVINPTSQDYEGFYFVGMKHVLFPGEIDFSMHLINTTYSCAAYSLCHFFEEISAYYVQYAQDLAIYESEFIQIPNEWLFHLQMQGGPGIVEGALNSSHTIGSFLRVTYFFTPEPGAVALLALGLPGVVMARRRRK